MFVNSSKIDSIRHDMLCRRKISKKNNTNICLYNNIERKIDFVAYYRICGRID